MVHQPSWIPPTGRRSRHWRRFRSPTAVASVVTRREIPHANWKNAIDAKNTPGGHPVLPVHGRDGEVDDRGTDRRHRRTPCGQSVIGLSRVYRGHSVDADTAVGSGGRAAADNSQMPDRLRRSQPPISQRSAADGSIVHVTTTFPAKAPEDSADVAPSGEHPPVATGPHRLVVLLVATTVMYLWNITVNGMGNQFYAGAAQAGSKNWEALLFGSLDSANFITVDKPPRCRSG